MLREKNIYNLAKVERAYMEACGILSIYQTDMVKPGLPTFPDFDKPIQKMQFEVDSNTKACCVCGHVQQVQNGTTTCEICNSNDWSKAYLTPVSETL